VADRVDGRGLEDLGHEVLLFMQEFVRAEGLKIVVVFEGRDAAGKGGVIKRITERTNPRALRVVALPAPTERERTQWYFQRYVAHLPAAGSFRSSFWNTLRGSFLRGPPPSLANATP